MLSTIIATLFKIFVLVYVSFTPSALKVPFLLGLSALLLPSNIEVFVLPLYTFWWAGLLLCSIIFREFHESKLLTYADISLVILCGLSSPTVFVFLPLLLLRRFFDKGFPGDNVIILATLVIVFIQGLSIIRGFAFLSVKNATQLDLYLGEPYTSLRETLIKYFGWFVGYNYRKGGTPIVFYFSVLFFVFITVLTMAKRNIKLLELFLLTLASITLSLVRVDVRDIDRHFAGPRYFFYPWIFITWLLIQFCYYYKQFFIRVLVVILIFLSFTHFPRSWRRNHDDLDWAISVKQLKAKGVAEFPVHFDGVAQHRSSVTLKQQRQHDH